MEPSAQGALSPITAPESAEGGVGHIDPRSARRSGTKSTERAKWTDVVQAVCAVGLLALGTFGYFWTVLPVYQKERLAEQVADLELKQGDLTKQVANLQLERETLQKQNKDLAVEKSKKEEELAEYAKTITQQAVIPHFLIKVQSNAQDYKCSPTVWDLGEGKPRPPMTGETVIEEAFKDPGFRLLHETDRLLLINSIRGFVEKYSPRAAFASPLEIQHSAYFTGPFAGTPKPWPDPFRFSQTERENLERVFRLFEQALTATQAHLLPQQNEPIKLIPCPILGISPR